ncbi:hypothetical protein [Corynebacterium sp. AOP12-C2-36]|uniref:hypothetical protein n=1 Tax=Corynebacterium sp. AOP12-C2-36 TaxID=3457723 RepID=UPI00403403DB
MNDSSGEANRRRIARVRSAAAPRVQVHGHHHTAAVVSGSVLGLNLEKGRGSVPICDTSTCSWTSPCGRQDTSDDAA